jgi:hypothetical protein
MPVQVPAKVPFQAAVKARRSANASARCASPTAGSSARSAKVLATLISLWRERILNPRAFAVRCNSVCAGGNI